MSNPFAFTDKHGMEWDLSIDLATARVIDRSDYTSEGVTKLQFAFLSPDREFFGEIFNNRGLASALAYTIAKATGQLERRLPEYNSDWNDEELQYQFAKCLNGQALRDLHVAVLRAVGDFFPEHKTVLSMLETRQQKVIQRLAVETEAMAADLDQHLDRELTKGIKALRSNVKSVTLGETSTSPAAT